MTAACGGGASGGPRAVAVIVVRDGVLPDGALETAAEAGGHALLAGTGTADAAGGLSGPGEVRCAELGAFAPARWAAALGPEVTASSLVLLPASADGRDLAPRLAHVLRRPLLAGALSATTERVVVARHGMRVRETHIVAGPVVATLLPGVRGVAPMQGTPQVTAITLPDPPPAAGADAEVLEVLPPDPATMDLSEAARVVAGGAGLGSPGRFELLARVCAALGASPGATRVVADAGWVPAHRYIGTTGVAVNPDLYVAMGISGAVQHVTGIGNPSHVVAVNTDPSAPMMSLADMAIVSDAPAVLEQLAALLGVDSGAEK